MKPLLKSGFISIMLALSLIAFAGEGDVAKVIILKGTVKARLKDKSVITLKKGDWLPEGAEVKTEPKSFVKLLFIDKSQMNLGPSSQMIINKFPKKKAGIITLMKGQLRSKVTKDYMQIDKNKEKLYIKTKTAAMGVRGTDFEVSVGEDGMTSTNLYEGRLVVTNIAEGISPAAVRQAFLNPANLTPINAGQMAVFKGDKAPPAVIKIPANIMNEASKTGAKGGTLNTLSIKTSKITGGNNLLLPGTSKKDVANSSAGEASKTMTTGSAGPAISKIDSSVKDSRNKGPGPTPDHVNGPRRGPASVNSGPQGENPPPPPPGDAEGCPLSGCGGMQGSINPQGKFVSPDGPGPHNGPAPDGPKLEDPCVMDPSICEVAPPVDDICTINPQHASCGGGAASSTNVQFNISVP